jgi:hypothetical protein
MPHGRAAAKLSLLAALVVAAIMLAVPVTASADALVSNAGHGQDCAFYIGGNVYGGSGTEVVTSTGKVILSCHLSLVSGTAVDRPTTTTIGNCELLEAPGGAARASCRFEL